MPMNFAVNKETGGLERYYTNPELTEKEAEIIAVARLSNGLSEIAKGLNAIADAIGDVAREMKYQSE